MIQLADSAKAHEDAGAAYLALRELYGTEAYKTVTAWVQALAAQQLVLMTNCRRDVLPDTQVRLKQLVAMADALSSPEPGQTGHVFD